MVKDEFKLTIDIEVSFFISDWYKK